jgi:hypothetical protein
MRSINRKPALILLAVLAAPGASAAAATAHATPTDAITMNWQTPYVTAPPWDGTGTGGFSASGASVNDAGSLSVAFHLGSSASHAGSILTQSSTRTLTGQLGTITLHCSEITHNAVANLVPITGHCTVISGTGAYTALHGQGELTGTGDLSGPTIAVISELVELRTS